MSDGPHGSVKLNPIDEGRALEIEFAQGDGLRRIVLPTSAVDGLIAALAQVREQMQPPIGTDIPLGRPVPAVADPRWYTETDRMLGGSAFMFRHPAFGWITVILTPDDAEKLAPLLQAQAREARSLSRGTPN